MPLVNAHSLKVMKGFTLLEVMLSMAVFSIAGLALLSTANTNITNLNSLEEKIVASWIASNQLVEVNLINKWPPDKEAKGSVELAGQQWYWQQKVLETADDDLRQLTIEVRIEEKSEQETSSLVTFVTKEE